MARPVPARYHADEVLMARILEIYNDNYQVYGCRKIRAALARDGIVVDKGRVAHLMRELGIRGVTRSDCLTSMASVDGVL